MYVIKVDVSKASSDYAYPKRLGWNPQCKYGRLGRAASSRTHIRAEQKAAISPSGEARVNFLKILVEVSP